ncbi:hypothetical protein [Niveibacterium sp. SC-1]|uniref:hypothetical protein n=1 Tax=Niveibacterium sp. SC-1 TaxID=3135646 RepID=UPI00311FFE76
MLMLLDGKPTYAYALSHYPEHKTRIQGPPPLERSKHTAVMDFAYGGGGVGEGGDGHAIGRWQTSRPGLHREDHPGTRVAR